MWKYGAALTATLAVGFVAGNYTHLLTAKVDVTCPVQIVHDGAFPVAPPPPPVPAMRPPRHFSTSGFPSY